MFVQRGKIALLYRKHLSLPPGTRCLHGKSHSGQNMIEKIVQKHAVGLAEGQIVKAKDFVTIRPAYVMTHDNTAAVMEKFKSIGASSFKDNRQPVFTLDHNVQDRSEKNLKKYANIEAFAKQHKVDFYPAGRGIGHQIMCEEGYAFPYSLVVASDSHSNMYGGLGCLGTPVVRTDAAGLWATSQTWWQVPPVAKVVLNGSLQKGVTGKDVIIALCGLFSNDEVLNHAVEFSGPGVEALSIDERLSIANMTTEWGCLAGVFPVDEKVISWLNNRSQRLLTRGPAGVPSDLDSILKNSKRENSRINTRSIRRVMELSKEFRPCEDATYNRTLMLDLSSVRPYVAGPNSVKAMSSITEIQDAKIPIDKAYLVSCVNSRVSDIIAAADVVKGRKVSDRVQFYIAPASAEVKEECVNLGAWQTLLDAGAIELPPGCGPCIGLGEGLLKDGEIGISATNRNFRGRMGSSSAQAYLASPQVVAASAIAGYIKSDINFQSDSLLSSYSEKVGNMGDTAVNVPIFPGFPKEIEGEMIFCNQDNINTDGIYPGKYTYREELSPEEMAAVAMENYDSSFGHLVKKNDVLVAGFNFGTGSSREQAATCLKYAGIQVVVAGSFSETFKRNSLNNGFLVIEIPELVHDLKAFLEGAPISCRSGLSLKINFTNSTATISNMHHQNELYVEHNFRTCYKFDPVGTIAQELILRGGLENWTTYKLESETSRAPLQATMDK